MKKVIGILGIAIFSMVMFTNTSSQTENSDLSMQNLTTIKEANAECGGGIDWPGTRRCNSFDRCSAFGSGNPC